MNYSDIIQALNEASAFDLYRLQTALDNMIDDPKRLIEVKKALRLGMEIEYYDAAANRVEPAIVEKVKQTKAVVKNLRDGKRWQIHLCSINVRGSDTDITLANSTGLSKNELSIGDTVGFVDKNGVEQHGIAVRLNPKTVTVEADQCGWRVSYALLYKVIEHNKD
ncbi:hypothetical protein P886_2185 [Alteromonadaceae bacterium 2753L.S.0a.02]|nr:hypothetical protein P886_2185 [Alteromonadaceae bacterium 2753L.S.0a.02]